MVMNWTDTVDKEMLLHIITASAVKVDNQAIADHLNEKFSTNCTAKAVKEHYAGMRKKHEAALASGGTAPPTPTKAKSTPRTPTKRGKKAATSGDDDDEEASPSKKRVVAPRSARKVTSYKQEEVEESEQEIPEKGVEVNEGVKEEEEEKVSEEE